ncbi:RNA polymerase sigma factor [Aquimarina sp. SS2-1]|uniref:RNA polymerase sigma factor n=1 Tax=Aquimarina besae TaxID=3342247 RepID=UPI0036724922
MNLTRNFLLILIVRPIRKTNSLDKVSDEDLILRILEKNDTCLFSVIYDRYSKKVYNKCYGFSRSQQEAEDLTQDVFIKLFTKLSAFGGNSKFSTWLYAFTYNFCVNYVNRDKIRRIQDFSSSIDNHKYYLSSLDEVNDDKLLELNVDKLKKALNQIDPKDKAILLLKYQDDATIKELQSILKIGKSAVKMRLNRAKIKVLDEYYKLKDM